MCVRRECIIVKVFAIVKERTFLHWNKDRSALRTKLQPPNLLISSKELKAFSAPRKQQSKNITVNVIQVGQVKICPRLEEEWLNIVFKSMTGITAPVVYQQGRLLQATIPQQHPSSEPVIYKTHPHPWDLSSSQRHRIHQPWLDQELWLNQE